MSDLVSVILPTYNERENIVFLIRELFSLGINLEVIVVDDASPDRTAEMVQKTFGKNSKVRLLERKVNDGLARAILAGIGMSRGRVIVGMDADGNHDPAILGDMLVRLRDCDVVVASRFVRSGGMDNKQRYVLTRGFNFFIRRIFGFPSTDNMSGYYAIRKSLLTILPLERIYRGYGDYHLRLMWGIKLMRRKITEMPVYYRERKYGRSKSRLISMFLVYLSECVRLFFVRRIDGI